MKIINVNTINISENDENKYNIAAYYYTISINDNTYIDIKQFLDGYAYICWGVYKKENNNEYNIREYTPFEEKEALKLVNEYYNNNFKKEEKQLWI